MKYRYFVLVVLSLIGYLSQAQPPKLTVQLGHNDIVYAVAFNKKYVVSGSKQTIKLWDFKTGDLLSTLKGHPGEVFDIALSNQKIVSAGEYAVMVWDLENGKLLKTLKAGKYTTFRSVALYQDLIVTGDSDNQVKIWDLNKGTLINTLKGHNDRVNTVACNHRYIVSGSEDKTVKIWDIKTGRLLKTLKGHTKAVNSVALGQQYVISGSDDYLVKVWDIQTGELVKSLKEEGYKGEVVSSVAFDGKYIISGSEDHTINVWELATSKLVRILEPENSVITIVAFDGQYIANSSYEGTIKVWKASTGELLNTLEGHSGYPKSLDFINQKLLVGTDQGVIKRWDIKPEVTIKTLEDKQDVPDIVWAFRFDGNYAIEKNTPSVVLNDMHLKLWNLETEQLVTKLKFPKTFVPMAYNSKYLAIRAADDRASIQLWDLRTGKLLKTLSGHTDAISKILIHDQFVISGSLDKTISFWDIKTGALVKNIYAYGAVLSFIAQDQYLVSAGFIYQMTVCDIETKKRITILHYNALIGPKAFNGKYIVGKDIDWKIKIRDYQTGRFLNIKILDNENQASYGLAIDQNHVMFAVENDIKVWDLKTGRLKHRLKGHTATVVKVVFSNQYVLSASKDQSIKVWDVNSGQLLLTLYSVFGKNNRAAWLAYTPAGQYDGNETGLKYLKYKQGDKILPLHEKDPKRVDGLLNKILK